MASWVSSIFVALPTRLPPRSVKVDDLHPWFVTSERVQRNEGFVFMTCCVSQILWDFGQSLTWCIFSRFLRKELIVSTSFYMKRLDVYIEFLREELVI